jgi:hypothetical protein
MAVTRARLQISVDASEQIQNQAALPQEEFSQKNLKNSPRERPYYVS